MLVVGCAKPPEGPPSTIDVSIGERTFTLEVALDKPSRTKGLSGRDHIAAPGGMLFAFRAPQRLSFWMKGCLVPIDIIFLDGQGHVINVHRMKPPPPGTVDRDLKAYLSEVGRGSPVPAQFAIELAGGTLDTLDVRPGERIELPLERLKRWVR